MYNVLHDQYQTDSKTYLQEQERYQLLTSDQGGAIALERHTERLTKMDNKKKKWNVKQNKKQKNLLLSIEERRKKIIRNEKNLNINLSQQFHNDFNSILEMQTKIDRSPSFTWSNGEYFKSEGESVASRNMEKHL